MSAGPILLALWATTNTELKPVSFVHLTSILGLQFTDSLVATGPLFAGTVFHTKRGNNCVFDSLLDFSRIICPRVMMYVSF